MPDIALKGVALKGAALKDIALKDVALKGVALKGVALESVALKSTDGCVHACQMLALPSTGCLACCMSCSAADPDPSKPW